MSAAPTPGGAPAAEWYARARGWRVLPLWWPLEGGMCACGEPSCSSPGKHPIGRLALRGVHDASSSPEQIRAWWAEYPLANVGLACGSPDGPLVLDIDGPAGAEALEALEAELGKLPATAEVVTGKGRHLYFIAPEQQVKNRVRVVAGVDVRSSGGYVVLPPSAHALGHDYEWVRLPGKLAALPAAWVERLVGPKGPPVDEEARRPRPARAPLPAGAGWGRKRLEENCAEVSSAPAGERNIVLNRAAFKVGQAVGAGELEEALAWQELLEAASACGLEELEARRTISSGLNKGRQQPVWPAAKPGPAAPRVVAKKEEVTEPAAAQPPAPEPGAATAKWTELANAERLVARHGLDLLYCPQLGGWHVWDGRRFARDEVGEVERRAKQCSKELYFEACDELRAALGDEQATAVAKKSLSWATKSQSSGNLSATIELAKTEPGVMVLPAEVDADHFALNAKNGTINLKTGLLRAHSREDKITLLSGAECLAVETPIWDSFLARTFDGDVELISFVQRLLGYSLVGLPTEDVLAVFWGGGANGKSTLVNTVAYVLGGYYRQLDPDVLLVAKGGTSSKTDSEMAALKGVRLATCSETSRLRVIDEGQLKQLASADQIVGKRLYKDPISFPPTHQLILITNHRPVIRSTDVGTWRRILLVPFTVTIPEAERDGQLSQKLRAEAPGVLRWMVDGCLEWQRLGLAPCEAVLAATREYRSDQDDIGDFIASHCILSPGVRTSAGDLYSGYRRWCEDNGADRPMSQKAFGESLTERGIERVKSRGVKWYLGILIRTEGTIEREVGDGGGR